MGSLRCGTYPVPRGGRASGRAGDAAMRRASPHEAGDGCGRRVRGAHSVVVSDQTVRAWTEARESFACATTFSAVKPNSSNSFSAAADAP